MGRFMVGLGRFRVGSWSGWVSLSRFMVVSLRSVWVGSWFGLGQFGSVHGRVGSVHGQFGLV